MSPKCNDWCLYKRKEWELWTHRNRGHTDGGLEKIKEGIAGVQPQVKGCQGLQEPPEATQEAKNASSDPAEGPNHASILRSDA